MPVFHGKKVIFASISQYFPLAGKKVIFASISQYFPLEPYLPCREILLNATGKYRGVEFAAQPCFLVMFTFCSYNDIKELEDLKVLRRSPDLFNNVKIGQGQLGLIIKHILFEHIWGLQPFWSSDLKQSNKSSIKQPSDF